MKSLGRLIFEMSNIVTIKAWLEKNKDIFDKNTLIAQACSRFECSKAQALEILKSKDIEIVPGLAESFSAIQSYQNWNTRNKLRRPNDWKKIKFYPGIVVKKKLEPEEEDVLEKFLVPVHQQLPDALKKKEEGRFTKLAMIVDISKWYEEKGFVTQKQYDILKKYVFDKVKASLH